MPRSRGQGRADRTARRGRVGYGVILPAPGCLTVPERVLDGGVGEGQAATAVHRRPPPTPARGDGPSRLCGRHSRPRWRENHRSAGCRRVGPSRRPSMVPPTKVRGALESGLPNPMWWNPEQFATVTGPASRPRRPGGVIAADHVGNPHADPRDGSAGPAWPAGCRWCRSCPARGRRAVPWHVAVTPVVRAGSNTAISDDENALSGDLGPLQAGSHGPVGSRESSGPSPEPRSVRVRWTGP